VTEATRVPAVAWMTSQSMMIVRSPERPGRVTARATARSDAWISWSSEIGPASSPSAAGFGGAGQHGVFGRHPAGALAFKNGGALLSMVAAAAPASFRSDEGEPSA